MGFSKVYYGPIPPLQPNSWAVLFRFACRKFLTLTIMSVFPLYISPVYTTVYSTLCVCRVCVFHREVLHVRRDDQLLAFRLDCPVSGHQLRVVDNDDGREMPRVAHITEPQEFSINKVCVYVCIICVCYIVISKWFNFFLILSLHH